MLETLIRLGYVSPRHDHTTGTLGSYENVPCITIYGNPIGSSAMMARVDDAKLEQYSQRNLPGASPQ